jgi:hypothetical protein
VVRKRIVIAAIAVLVVGGLAHVLSQPRTGTIEYHKKEYVAAFRKGALADLVVDRGVTAADRLDWKSRRRRIEFHRDALISAGFFEQKEFILSNRPPRDALRKLLADFARVFTNETDVLGAPLIRGITTNRVIIAGEARVMREVERLVREADVPENAK